MIVRVLALAVLLGGCATSSKERLRAACEADVASDPRCLEVLTADEDEYESRKEVMAAEARREAREFDDRLARLRREEEERQANRTRTSSATEDLSEEVSEEAKDLADAKIEGPGALEVG